MATKGKLTYTDGAGKSFDLGSADDLALALSDVGARLGALEAQKGAAVDGSGGDTAARLTRLETVSGDFLRSEFADYDAGIAASEPNDGGAKSGA